MLGDADGSQLQVKSRGHVCVGVCITVCVCVCVERERERAGGWIEEESETYAQRLGRLDL